MIIEDFDGQLSVSSAAELVQRLTAVRKNEFGAFILYHDDNGPSLWIHIKGEAAYLHYFKDASRKHAGFQSTSSRDLDSNSVKFLQVNGTEADAIEVPPESIISLAEANGAAVEFFERGTLPASITWSEL